MIRFFHFIYVPVFFTIKVFAIIAVIFTLSSCTQVHNSRLDKSEVFYPQKNFSLPPFEYVDIKKNTEACLDNKIENQVLISIALKTLNLDSIPDRHDVEIREVGCNYLVGIIPDEGIGGGLIIKISREGLVVGKIVTH